MAGPPEDRRAIQPETIALGGALVAAAGLILAAATGAPFLSSAGVNGWIVVFAAGLLVALVALPFGIETRLRRRYEDRDARWDRAVPVWGAIGLLVLVAGALVGAGGSFSGDSLAGAAGLLAVMEGGLVVVTTLSMLLSG
jgi:hypothetical protein